MVLSWLGERANNKRPVLSERGFSAALEGFTRRETTEEEDASFNSVTVTVRAKICQKRQLSGVFPEKGVCVCVCWVGEQFGTGRPVRKFWIRSGLVPERSRVKRRGKDPFAAGPDVHVLNYRPTQHFSDQFITIHKCFYSTRELSECLLV